MSSYIIYIACHVILGLIAARWVFTRAVRRGNYEPRWNDEKPPTQLFMAVAFLLAPVWFAVMVASGACRLLTIKPPVPKQALDQRIKELEKELDI